MIAAIKAMITRFVDDIQPGRVECEFEDAWGKIHRFIDKTPIFTDGFLDEHSAYPVDGQITVKVIEKRPNSMIVTTGEPWHVESTKGETVFEVPAEAILPPVPRTNDLSR